MHDVSITSLDDYQKVANTIREDRKLEGQLLTDRHNRRAGKLQWLRQALYEGGSANLGGKPVFEGDQLEALTKRYARCLLAWTRSDELDGEVEEAGVKRSEQVHPEAPYTT